MAVILDLPFQEQLDRSTGVKSEGFGLNTIEYSGKVTQRAFSGASVEASREEVYRIDWAFLEYANPEEVLGGKINQLKLVRDFYKDVQTGYVRWKPFELASTRIWRVLPNSLKVKNIAGCIFTVSLDLEFLYNE